jgi:hypothetical protein
MLRIIDEDPYLTNLVLMCDEAHFHVTGFVNKQNIRHWAPVNPREFHEQPLYSPKVTVWCGVGSFGIVGSVFFENDNGATITVTAERYVALCKTSCFRSWKHVVLIQTNLYFQQDGAIAHTAGRNMEVVHSLFHQNILRFGDIQWPARSPDLTAPDFFLRGFFKERAYRNRQHTHTAEELKRAIQAEIAVINQDQDLLRRVFDNFVDRLRQCTATEGGHLTDVMYHK